MCSENGAQAEAGISRDRDTSFEFYPCEVSRGESWSEYIINLFYIWDTSEGGGGPSGSGGGAVRCLSQCQCRARGSPGPSSPRGSSSRADGVICPAFVAWRGRGRGGRRGGGVMGPLMDANLIGYSCVASLTKWTLRAPIFLFLPRWEGSHLTVLPPKLIQLGILLSFFYPFL